MSELHFFLNSERYEKLLATIRFVFKFLCHTRKFRLKYTDAKGSFYMLSF